MSRKSTLGDALAAHPSVDMLAPAIPIIIWAISGRPVPDDNVSQNLFVALSTLSGLVMAAVTFICSMSYQSESRYMQIARDRYHDELSRNWVSIIAWTAITAVLPAGIPLPLAVAPGTIHSHLHICTCHDDRKAGQKHPLDEIHAIHAKGIHDNRRTLY